MNCEGSSSFKTTFSISSTFFLEREIQLKSSKFYGSYFFLKANLGIFLATIFVEENLNFWLHVNFLFVLTFQQIIFEKEDSPFFWLTKFFFFSFVSQKTNGLGWKKKSLHQNLNAWTFRFLNISLLKTIRITILTFWKRWANGPFAHLSGKKAEICFNINT